jgi:hypothetical protein
MSKDNDQSKDSLPRDANAERRRKPYRRPTLTAYGNVREFTRGGGGTKADKGGFFST